MSFDSVRARMAEAAERAGRHTDEITLVVVSKERSVEDITALYAAGHRHFGENRAQELAAKVGELPGDISWHFVGPLQTNKVRLVRPATVLLHSLDRLELGRAWMKGPGLPPNALLQVNIGREPQKQGVDPEETLEAFASLLEMGVPMAGLMAIPPWSADPEQARPYFRSIGDLSARLCELAPEARAISMGMTDDFEVAIEEGATFIRVGRAIFDET
jgi:pyridoxal phosphate enzyme (YggS family)